MAKTGMIQDPQDMPCCFLQNSKIQMITLSPTYEAAKAENEYFA
jgi:hypothetical protein